MKTKVFLTSFALAALTGSMFVSCTNEELIKDNANIELQDGMIKLGENFMIGTVGSADAESRTHWVEDEKLLVNYYIPTVATSGNAQLGGKQVNAPAIGLCWLGTCTGSEVYTNYEFIHNGWLGGGEDSALFDECDQAVLNNGWLYSDLSAGSSITATDGQELFTKNGLGVVNHITSSHAAKSADGTTLSLSEMNLNSGVYKTDNKAIFGGNYIAYYPYNADFKDAGAIPAKSAVVFDNMPKNNIEDLSIAENTFRYSDVSSINGGDQASNFKLNNLSGLVKIQLKSTTATGVTGNVQKVMLYSKSSAFVKEVSLDPSKIAASAKGSELYIGEKKTSKTILVNMASENNLTIKGNTQPSFDCVYISALPTKIEDLMVLIQNTDGKWAECTIGEFEIKPGTGVLLDASFSEFKDVHYAVDDATLSEAINQCDTNGGGTIEVLGDVTVETSGNQVKTNTTITGDRLIIPENVTMSFQVGSTLESEVVVKGQTCCSSSSKGGELIIGGATIDGDIIVEDKELNAADTKKPGTIKLQGNGVANINGDITIAKGNLNVTTPTVNINGKVELVNGAVIAEENNTQLKVNGELIASGDLTINNTLNTLKESKVEVSGVKFISANAEVEGELSLNGESHVDATSIVNIKGGKLTNGKGGVFEVEGEFNVLDASGSTTSAAGENMINEGKFIDHVGSKIGGATQSMINKGDYICKVADDARIDEAYQNKAACNIIEIIANDLTADFSIVQQHKNSKGELFDVNIIVSATGVHFNPSQAITVGNITVSDGKGLRIRKTVDNAYITVNGDITSYGNFIVSGDVENLKAKNLYVKKSTAGDVKKAQFENRVNVVGKTMEVSGTISVEKGANFIIDAKGTPIFSGETGKNIAYVTCTKLVEGGTFSGKPIVVAE